MPLSTLERQVYDALGVLSILGWQLRLLHCNASLALEPVLNLPLMCDAETVNELGDLVSLAERAEGRLVGNDKRREIWSRAATYLICNKSDGFDAMLTEIMACASGLWSPSFSQEVITHL